MYHFNETVDLVRQVFDDEDDDDDDNNNNNNNNNNNSFVLSGHTKYSAKYFWQTAFHFVRLGCKSLYLQAEILV